MSWKIQGPYRKIDERRMSGQNTLQPFYSIQTQSDLGQGVSIGDNQLQKVNQQVETLSVDFSQLFMMVLT